MKSNITPEQIGREYSLAVQYKAAQGKHGMQQQNAINERFYSGDQWHGAGCGDNRPLVRQNIIRRIADYKMAVVGASPTSVAFSAEGVAQTLLSRRELEAWKRGEIDGATDAQGRLSQMAAALSDHFADTAERLKFEDLKQQVMQNAYITGTGILYTYWDDRLPTGLFADAARRQPIRGDIVSEVLHVDHVYLGDPTVENLQEQPFLLIAQRKEIAVLQETARRYGGDGWRHIRPDGGDDVYGRPKATLVTRFWKECDENGVQQVWGMQVCGKAVVRPKWCLGIRLYPLALFRWMTRSGCGYGESEITQLIPNQIAINRMATAGVWAMMMTGMPIMVVNGDIVTQPVTNDPGQVIPVYGSSDEIAGAIRYVEPPAYSSQFESGISTLIEETLAQAGVNGVVLGDVRPDNATAYLAVREASIKPMQLVRNRLFSFCEDVARIWAEFWIHLYGRRPLRLHTADGYRYCAFDGDSCVDMLFSVKVDVEESVSSDIGTALEILQQLYKEGVINARQYISRLPAGSIPQQRRLLQEMEEAGERTE